MKDKHKSYKAFCALSGKQVKRSLEIDAAAGSLKPGALDSLIPRLGANLFPWKNFEIYIKNMVLMDPRGNKGTKYKLSDKTELC